jgi:glutathione reductase (NADPH)
MRELSVDVGVIGSGPAGLAAAFGLREAGLSVAIVEKYLWGGTCPNYGCDPKKFLVTAADAVRTTERLAGRGIAGRVTVNWPELMAAKTAFVSSTPSRTLGGLTGYGIQTVDGEARFLCPTTVVVEPRFVKPGTPGVGSDEAAATPADVGVGEPTTITAKTWVIAVGQTPRPATFPGAELVGTSEDFLSMTTMPEDITVVGGGYVALELASLALNSGARVHMLLRGDTALRGFDPDLVEELLSDLAARGMDIRRNVEIASVEPGLRVNLSDGTELSTGAVINAAGRIANTHGLGLAEIGVEHDSAGIAVDEYLATNVPGIYVVGDVAHAGVPKLTPVGGFQGRYLARLLAEGADAVGPITYPAIPTIAFSSPEIATIGVSPSSAAEHGFAVRDLDMTSWYNYARRADNAHAKVVVDDGGDIVGAAVRSHDAGTIINDIAVIMDTGRTKRDVLNHIAAYPTLTSDVSYFF